MIITKFLRQNQNEETTLISNDIVIIQTRGLPVNAHLISGPSISLKHTTPE